MATSNKLSDAVKTLVWGVLLTLGALWFWHQSIGNPLDEISLIRRAHVVMGVLVDTYEHEEEDNRGNVGLSDVGVYTFQTPDGREFKTSTRVPTDQLNKQQQVEYLPNDPAVNRIKGDGCASVLEWLWRTVGLGGLLLALFVSPGIILLRDGVRDIKRLRTATGKNSDGENK